MKQIVYKGDFIESLSKDALEKGYIKFNIPDEDELHSLNGEGVWGWVSEDYKEMYRDDHFYGKIKAILLNQPLTYFPVLQWGAEVVLSCHGRSRPTLDPDWVKEYILEAETEVSGDDHLP